MKIGRALTELRPDATIYPESVGPLPKNMRGLKIRFAVIALSAVALTAFLTTGAIMNRACKTDRSLGWCAPAHTQVTPNL
jgi:hypothetical protein